MLLVSLVVLALLIYPCWKILDRMGFNGALSLLCLIPFMPLIGLWLLAFKPWPAGGKPPSTPMNS